MTQLQLDEIPSWLEGTKNCFTDALLYRNISRADEVESTWSSGLEMDTASGQVDAGHNIFALIALSEWLDAEIAIDDLRARRQARL
jgi:hypothetical protein